MSIRAYSLLEVKSIDEDQRVITGMATTPEVDRMGDIVNPMGVKFTNPLALLWQHQHGSPVGTVKFGKPTKAGIPFEAVLPIIEAAGALKDLIDMAWQAVKAKLVRGVSIGFRPLKYSYMESGGVEYSETEVYELSLVTIPANAGATIQTIKSYDAQQLAALGREAGVVSLKTSVRFSFPGVSGQSVVKILKPPEPHMNVQEQIKSFQAARAAKLAAAEAIMKKAADAGETLTAEEGTAYDEAQTEVATIDKHLARLESMQKAQLAQARAVATVVPGQETEGATAAAAAAREPSRIIAVQPKLEKGIAFARFAGLVARSEGNLHSAHEIAKELFPTEKPLQAIIKMIANRGNDWVAKAAVDIGTSVDTDYAAPLVNYTNMVNDFLEFLRPQTIIGQIPGLMRVPFNVRVPRQTNGGSASWVGEGAPKPVTATAFDFVDLKYTKLATIAVITQELARFSSPSAETIIRNTLASAIIQQGDADFVNPANAGTANVKPASITNGSTSVASGGSTYQDVLDDISAVFAPFIAANLSPQNGVWLMSATTALALSLMRLPIGAAGSGIQAFPAVSMAGGTFWGMPVIVSEAVGNIVVLLNASDIMLADDGQVTIDVSREASVQMDSAPTNPVVAATVLVSLWQQNLIGIRAERFINWVKGRAAAVAYITGVTWGQAST